MKQVIKRILKELLKIVIIVGYIMAFVKFFCVDDDIADKIEYGLSVIVLTIFFLDRE